MQKEIEVTFFPFPWESQGSHIGSFLLWFTYPSYRPLQTDTYIHELVQIFLKLSMKTVQVHLIIRTTLVAGEDSLVKLVLFVRQVFNLNFDTSFVKIGQKFTELRVQHNE